MPAPPIDPWTTRELTRKLHEQYGLTHLRVRKHGRLLTVESGPEDDPWRHVRFRRDTVHLWKLEVAVRSRWEKTPFRAYLDDLVAMVTGELGWTVAQVLENPGATSDRGY